MIRDRSTGKVSGFRVKKYEVRSAPIKNWPSVATMKDEHFLGALDMWKKDTEAHYNFFIELEKAKAGKK